VDQPTSDKIEHPGHFTVRTADGSVLQEYLLDKRQVVVGRGPESDLCFPEDMLVSRAHATIRYEQGNYILRDEGSANGTLINNQPLDRMTNWTLQDGDKILVGDHELAFRAAIPVSSDIAEDATMIVVPGSIPGMSGIDEEATVVGSDPLETQAWSQQSAEQLPVSPPTTPEPVANVPAPSDAADVQESAPPHTPPQPPEKIDSDLEKGPPPPVETKTTSVTVSQLTMLTQPSLPDTASLLAASATLNEQITALQNQLNTTHEAVQNHEAEIAQKASQLRLEMRSIADRMDNTIAGMARSRTEQHWDELMQLMQEVINSPRDIGYAMEFARKAADVEKVFQRYQGVLSTLAECNSLLRSLIGEDKP